MSSKQNGLMKKTASSVPFIRDHDSSSSFSSEESEKINKNPGQDDLWRMIQSQKEVKKPAKSDVNWGMILTQKSDNSVLPPPYVHPLVKISMSGKSLEICTESLGSETGSDGLSTNPDYQFVSDDGDQEERTRVVRKECTKEPNPLDDFRVVKYKNWPSRPIPPTLSSLSLRIQSHRKKGTLVLEAVAVVPPRIYIHAQCGYGRLVLSFINSPTSRL